MIGTLLALMLAAPADAGGTPVEIDKLGLPDGLSDTTVFSIIQDDLRPRMSVGINTTPDDYAGGSPGGSLVRRCGPLVGSCPKRDSLSPSGPGSRCAISETLIFSMS